MDYRDRTYENIMRECLEHAPEGVDLRQGGIFYDAVAAACAGLAKYYAALQNSFDLVFVMTAVGEYLDRRGWEFGVFRLPATSALYKYSWTGDTEPNIGERFFANEMFFVLRRNSEGLYLEAETPGIIANNIISGTAAIPVNNLSGLSSSAFGELIESGTDTERDEDFRERIIEKILGPAENGNRQHYKTWCESIAGVGRARIIPLFAGENTVMGVIMGTDGLPAASTVVQRVQEYIDPMSLGLTVTVGDEVIPVGDGLGDGAANIGAHFAAAAPFLLSIDVSFSAELKNGYGTQRLKSDVSAALADFLKNLMLTTPERESVIIRVSAISAILYSQEGLIDYTDLTLNGKAGNISLTDRQCAALGEVTINNE